MQVFDFCTIHHEIVIGHIDQLVVVLILSRRKLSALVNQDLFFFAIGFEKEIGTIGHMLPRLDLQHLVVIKMTMVVSKAVEVFLYLLKQLHKGDVQPHSRPMGAGFQGILQMSGSGPFEIEDGIEKGIEIRFQKLFDRLPVFCWDGI